MELSPRGSQPPGVRGEAMGRCWGAARSRFPALPLASGRPLQPSGGPWIRWGSLGRDTWSPGWWSQRGEASRLPARTRGCGGTPTRAPRPYLQQVRPQLLGDAVQGPGAARLSPRVS